jgi:hypothetical protein
MAYLQEDRSQDLPRPPQSAPPPGMPAPSLTPTPEPPPSLTDEQKRVRSRDSMERRRQARIHERIRGYREWAVLGFCAALVGAGLFAVGMLLFDSLARGQGSSGTLLAFASLVLNGMAFFLGFIGLGVAALTFSLYVIEVNLRYLRLYLSRLIALVFVLGGFLGLSLHRMYQEAALLLAILPCYAVGAALYYDPTLKE